MESSKDIKGLTPTELAFVRYNTAQNHFYKVKVETQKAQYFSDLLKVKRKTCSQVTNLILLMICLKRQIVAITATSLVPTNLNIRSYLSNCRFLLNMQSFYFVIVLELKLEEVFLFEIHFTFLLLYNQQPNCLSKT